MRTIFSGRSPRIAWALMAAVGVLAFGVGRGHAVGANSRRAGSSAATSRRSASDPPRAVAQWSLPLRLPLWRGHVPHETLNTDRRALLELNGCRSSSGNVGPIIRFTWTFSGPDAPLPVSKQRCLAQVFRPLRSAWTTWQIHLTVSQRDGQEDSTTVVAKFRDLLVVSVGDSAASGEGNPEIPYSASVFDPCVAPPKQVCGDPSDAKWSPRDGLRCDRSGWAASAQAAYALQTPNQSVTFWHLACSGANITDNTEKESTVSAQTSTCAKNKLCTVDLPVPETFVSLPVGTVTAFVNGHPFVQLWLPKGVPALTTRIVGTYYGRVRTFPKGTTLEIDDYGNGGMLTPYDGENKPVGPNPFKPSVMCTPVSSPAGCHQPMPSQLDQLKQLVKSAHRPIDALLLTIGANDVDWTPLVEACYGPRFFGAQKDCIKKEGPPVEARLQTNADYTTGFLPDRMAQLADRLAGLSVVNPQRVFLTEYWDATAETATGGQVKYCGGYGSPTYLYSPTTSERHWGQQHVIIPMNTILAAQPARFGWHDWIGGPAFEHMWYGHGLCGTHSWFVSPAQSAGTADSANPYGQGDKNGSWHASHPGQKAFAGMILQKVTPTVAVSLPAAPLDRFLLETGTPLKGNDAELERFELQLADYNQDGVPDIYALNRQNGSLEVHVLDGASNYQRFLLETSTPLKGFAGQLAQFQFFIGDYNHDGKPDIYALNTSTGSNSLEVHVLDGSSHYQRYLLETATPLKGDAAYLADYRFFLSDYNHDGRPDIYALRAASTLEVHILDGASSYQRYLLETSTPIDESDFGFAGFQFALGDFNQDGVPDIYALDKGETGNSLQVSVLDGAAGYQHYLVDKPTPLLGTQGELAGYQFFLADYDHDGSPDIYALRTSQTGTGSLEVHVLSGASSYGRFALESGTPLKGTDAELAGFQFFVSPFDLDGEARIFALRKEQTGTGSLEVHILGGM